MTRVSMLVATVALFCVAVPANGQALKDQVLGTWTLVSNVQKYQDGKEENDFGPNGKGPPDLRPNELVFPADHWW